MGPGGQFLTTADTMRKCRTHSWNPEVSLRGNLGGRDPHEAFLANVTRKRQRMITDYKRPVLPENVKTRLLDFLAARGVDRARGEMRTREPERAFETWTSLVSGRWSMVDWFDTDGRRYVLAVPNPPEAPDPRGLTEQEAQVVAYVMLGETSKLIAYRLGLSKARISGLLSSAMRKLGVKSKTALVEKLRPLGSPTPAD